MKKLVALLIAVTVLSTTTFASAKTLKEALHGINVEKTAVATEKVLKTIPRGAYYLVKGVMIGLAAPFYWAEKLSERKTNNYVNSEIEF